MSLGTPNCSGSSPSKTGLPVTVLSRYAKGHVLPNTTRAKELWKILTKLSSMIISMKDRNYHLDRFEVADGVIKAISTGRYGFIVVNFANGDMVGHTAKRHAILSAVKTLDREVGRVLDATVTAGYSVVLTADHGNCEEMVDPLTGVPHTQHTTYPVPCMVMDQENWKLSCDSGLSSVAPTVLELMGIKVPAAMTSPSLLLQSFKRIAWEQEPETLQGAA